jgi:hypothetical protein
MISTPTKDHLSSEGGKYSAEKISTKTREDLHRVLTTSDAAEAFFGMFKWNVDRFPKMRQSRYCIFHFFVRVVLWTKAKNYPTPVPWQCDCVGSGPDQQTVAPPQLLPERTPFRTAGRGEVDAIRRPDSARARGAHRVRAGFGGERAEGRPGALRLLLPR